MLSSRQLRCLGSLGQDRRQPARCSDIYGCAHGGGSEGKNTEGNKSYRNGGQTTREISLSFIVAVVTVYPYKNKVLRVVLEVHLLVRIPITRKWGKIVLFGSKVESRFHMNVYIDTSLTIKHAVHAAANNCVCIYILSFSALESENPPISS